MFPDVGDFASHSEHTRHQVQIKTDRAYCVALKKAFVISTKYRDSQTVRESLFETIAQDSVSQEIDEKVKISEEE